MIKRPMVMKIGKRRWLLMKPFYHVPIGFVSDGASVPRILWWFMDPAGEAFEAAIVHDYDLLHDKSKNQMVSHRRFKYNLIRYNVRPWKAHLAYFAVVANSIIKGI